MTYRFFGMACRDTPVEAVNWIVDYAARKTGSGEFTQAQADRLVAGEVREILNQVNAKARVCAADADPAFADVMGAEAAE